MSSTSLSLEAPLCCSLSTDFCNDETVSWSSLGFGTTPELISCLLSSKIVATSLCFFDILWRNDWTSSFCLYRVFRSLAIGPILFSSSSSMAKAFPRSFAFSLNSPTAAPAFLRSSALSSSLSLRFPRRSPKLLTVSAIGWPSAPIASASLSKSSPPFCTFPNPFSRSFASSRSPLILSRSLGSFGELSVALSLSSALFSPFSKSLAFSLKSPSLAKISARAWALSEMK